MQRLLLILFAVFILNVSLFIPHTFAAQALAPQTGQITSYAAGDDGALRPGVTWDAASRFTPNGNGTVTDNLTGLIWLQNANCFSTQTWQTALNSANTLVGNNTQCSLNDGSVAGDWRLPNVDELESLVDLQRSNPALPADHPFSNLISFYYWSSSTYAYDTTFAWRVSMIDGFVGVNFKTFNHYVWPVRGGQGGALGSLNISSAALSFPATWPGKSSSKSVTVSSTLPGSVTIIAATLTGANAADFSLGDSCSGQTLTKNGSCNITVNFIPRTCGSKSATLTVPTSQGNLTAELNGAACGVGNATLGGVVTDAGSGLPISGAEVMVGANGPYSSDGTGQYTAGWLATGSYDLVVMKSGYDIWRGTITLNPQQSTWKSVNLFPAGSGLRVTSITSKYSSGKPYYFLPGVSFNVTFTAQVDWAGKTPSVVRFITSRGSYDVATTGNTASKTIDVGSELDPCAMLQAIAFAADDSQSAAKDADFRVTKALPVDPELMMITNNLAVQASGSSFSYINKSILSKDLLDQTIDIAYFKDIPILKDAATALKFAPEFDFEFTGEDGKASYNLSLFKNADFTSIYKKEYSRRKNVRGLVNLVKTIEHRISEGKFSRKNFPKGKISTFELTLFPDAKIETIFNPASCGTSASGWEAVTGYAGVAGAAEWNISYKGLTPTAVPVPYYIKGALGMEFDAMLNINKLLDLSPAGTIATNPYITGTGGPGVDAVVGVELSAKGGADIGWTLPAPSVQSALTSCNAFFSVTGKAYALLFEYQFPTKRWDVSCLPSNAQASLSAPIMSSVSPQKPVTPTLISRDYVSSPKSAPFRSAPEYAVKQFTSVGQAYSVASSPIVSGTFPVSSANLSSAGNNVNMLWLTDKYPERSAVNRTMLQHSTFDDTNWSTPMAIADNDTADFNPVSITFADGSIVAAWEDVKNVMADTATLEEMTAQLEIASSVFDPIAKTWSSSVRLTNNATLDRTPRLTGKSKDNMMLTWISNNQNDLSGSATKSNSLYYSLYNGTTWSQALMFSTIPNNIKRYSVVYDGMIANVALALDTDDNPETIEDLELYRMTYDGDTWGALTRLTTDTIIDDNPQLAIDVNNDVVMTWVKGNELSSVVNFDFDKRTVIRSEETYGSTLADFKLANAIDGKVGLIYGDRAETSTADLFAVFYDPIFKLWGMPKQLTSDAETEMRPSIAFMGTDTIVSVFNRKLLINLDGTPTTDALTDLYMLTHSLGEDLALEAGSLEIDPVNAAPGNSVAISVNAQNLGDKVAQNILVSFFNGDPASGGTLIGSATITEPFIPGAVQKVSIVWTIPGTSTSLTIFAVIDPASTIDTLNRSNNVISRQLASPDLLLQTIRWEKGATGKYQFTIPVVNIGGTASPASNLTLYLGSETGELLTSMPVAALERFANVDYVYTFDNSVLQLPGFTVAAIIDESGLIQESDEDNNFAKVVIPSDTAVLAVTVDGSGDGTVTSDPQGTNPSGIACTSGTCTSTFPYGTIVNLLKTPDIYSLFNGWSVDCSGIDTCTVAMVGSKAVTSTFNLAPKIKLDVNATIGYDMFSDAYTNAIDVLFAMDAVVSGEWTLDGSKAIILKGGYQADYKARTGFTTMKGKLTIKNGSLRVDGVTIRPQ